jgi:MFS family permease
MTGGARDFRLVAGAVGLSALGDWVAIVALGLHVKDAADSGLAVAALWICLFGPSVAVAGHAGLLVDRLEATRVLACVSALGAAGAAALAVSGGLAPVLALTALLGIVFAVSQPAEFALVPLLAGERGIRAANGHVETVRYLGYAVGPLLGGVLFAVGGLGLAMVVDAATFAAVAAAALALRVRRKGTAEDRAPRARDGIAFLARDKVLSLAMLVAFGSLLFMSAVWVGELFFVQDVLGKGEVAYGLMLSVWTVGMALGAMLVSRRIAAGATATGALAAVAIQGSALALPAAFLGFGFFLACMFMGGLAHGGQERPVPQPDPLACPRSAPRAGVRRLQRDPQLGGARRVRGGRALDRRDRRSWHGGGRRRSCGDRGPRRAGRNAADARGLAAGKSGRPCSIRRSGA